MLNEAAADLARLLGIPYAVELTDAVVATTASDDDVESDAVIHIEVARLRRAMRDLSDFDQHLLTARYGLGLREPLSLRELASRLNCSHSTVRRMERRAVEHLRDIYAQELAA